ncbi:MAG: hypothetical protein ACRCWO_08560 [Bosea sp. (in: a-proteobacteria)]
MLPIDSSVAASVAQPQDQRQMYQFQSLATERGHSGADQSRVDSQFMTVDREIGRDLKLSTANGPRVGDGLLRDFSRFGNMMVSLESSRDARSASLKTQQRANRERTGEDGGSSATTQTGPSAFDNAIADYRRAAEYAAYLSAMAVIVQNGVSSIKRLQQG